MSTLNLVPDTGDEMPSQQVARRIRGWMAEYQVTGRQLATIMHIDQASFSRRYAGHKAWSFDEMVEICRLLNKPLEELCAIRDSNPEPADLEETGPDLRLVLGTSGSINETGSVSDRSVVHDELEP